MRRLDYDPGGRTRFGCAWLSGCLVWASALFLCPLGYAIVGIVAPADDSESRQGMRDFFRIMELHPLAFLAEITMAQFLTAIFTSIGLLFLGGIVGAIRGGRAVRRLPCRECGATPMRETGAGPLELTCDRCGIVWIVNYRPGSGDDGAHSHIHHHPH